MRNPSKTSFPPKSYSEGWDEVEEAKDEKEDEEHLQSSPVARRCQRGCLVLSPSPARPLCSKAKRRERRVGGGGSLAAEVEGGNFPRLFLFALTQSSMLLGFCASLAVWGILRERERERGFQKSM